MSKELTAQEIWSLILKECEGRLNQQTISTWLTSSRAVSLLEQGLTVELKNKFAACYVEQNYQIILNQVASLVLGRQFKINFLYPQGDEQIDMWEKSDEGSHDGKGKGGRDDDDSTQSLPSERTESFNLARSDRRLKGFLNPRYTFDNFIVGRNSQFAHAAALSVSTSPATRYNPLFIYGGTGLGKTHILQAIGHAILNNPKFKKIKICYISAEEFLNELISAITTGSTSQFRNYYRQMDVLLIDDIEFLAKKEATQAEFFHTFNTLYESQKQIVLTSDRPPREIHYLEERLRSRFQWGLVADILPPEFETRIAILRKKSAGDNILISQEVLEYIAENATSNVRLLEGSLIYLKHHYETHKTDINLEVAKRVLKTMFEQDVNHIGAEEILKAVADSYGIPEKNILSMKRKKSFVEPRQVAMYLCNKLTKYSLTEIAERFNRKDHTTVLHACKKITALCENDIKLKEKLEGIADRVKDQKMEL